MFSNKWDEILENEHELIERCLDVFKKELKKVSQNEHNSLPRQISVATFLSCFFSSVTIA